MLALIAVFLAAFTITGNIYHPASAARSCHRHGSKASRVILTHPVNVD
jgi:hypothetical protein